MIEYNPLNPAHNSAHIIQSLDDPWLKALSETEKRLMYGGTMPSRVVTDEFGKYACYISITPELVKQIKKFNIKI